MSRKTSHAGILILAAALVIVLLLTLASWKSLLGPMLGGEDSALADLPGVGSPSRAGAGRRKTGKPGEMSPTQDEHGASGGPGGLTGRLPGMEEMRRQTEKHRREMKEALEATNS